jgi:hypothetical protein
VVEAVYSVWLSWAVLVTSDVSLVVVVVVLLQYQNKVCKNVITSFKVIFYKKLYTTELYTLVSFSQEKITVVRLHPFKSSL